MTVPSWSGLLVGVLEVMLCQFGPRFSHPRSIHPLLKIAPNTAPERCRRASVVSEKPIRVARPHPDVLPPSLPPLGSIGAVRGFFRHRVRAVRSFWRDELDGLAGRPCHSEERSEKYTHRLAPFPGCGHTFCDRSRPQARPMATPSSRCCKDPSIGVGDHPELYDPTSYGARC